MLNQAKSVADSANASAGGGASIFAQIAAMARPVHLMQFAVVTLQLGLVLLVIRLFKIEESSGLLDLLTLVFGGFIVHAWLPRPWRMPFFFALTLAAIVLVFGVVNGGWLVVVALSMIGLAHLPIPYGVRVALLAGVGAVLVAFRGGWMNAPEPISITLTILGSMFMFRMVLYLYDMRSEKKKVSIWERLTYFFQLPNIIFPFYPIIDYITFRRTYYNKEDITIYQKGVLWMFRGVFHLILYRVVYYHMSPSVASIQDLSGVLLFIVSSYLLYLRISGLFHLIVGMMCLFGFNLPETHKMYFLASGFNDYWRRINIFWKDFMMKLFFYPLFMRVRHWGETTALVFSTIVVFACTWLLHSYQWFWLQGAFPLTVVDGVYWAGSWPQTRSGKPKRARRAKRWGCRPGI
jgi:D-alanyl-lipoteichoic acid acyltransferase DltB (MBOAT superfamily)